MRNTIKITIASFLIVAATTVVADGQDVNPLIDDLSSSNKPVCLQALRGITELGPDAKDATSALVTLLTHDDAEIRSQAALSLGSIGAAATSAVPALTKSLADEDASVRAYSAFALGAIGKAAEPAVKQLVKHAFDESELVRRAAIKALIKIDPPRESTRPLVLEVLDKGDMSIIVPALHSLAEEGQTVVPKLREALKTERGGYWACLVVAEIGPDAAAAIPELKALLAHADPDVRLQALVAIGSIGEGAQAAASLVLDRLQNDDFENVRYAAAFALGMIKAKEAAEPLSEFLDSDDEFLRTISAWAAARMNPTDKELVARAVKLIVAAFESQSADVRRLAAQAAIEFDVSVEILAPALIEALRDQDRQVVINAIGALASLGARALSHIDDALAHKELRPYAVMLIARLGSKAAPAVPALVKAISNRPADADDFQFIREAQFALARIGPAAARAVPALAKSLDSPDEQIQASAAYALGKIGHASRAAVPKLRQSLRNESEIVKLASVLALLEIQPGEPRLAIVAAPLLVRALESEYELVRAEAATALGEAAELGKRVIPQLRELLSDESELVREAAAASLKKLGA